MTNWVGLGYKFQKEEEAVYKIEKMKVRNLE
jgi:hypothetical protein